MGDVIGQIVGRLKKGQRTRILGFGSSNTERFLPGMHWFDCFDLSIRKYGRVHTCINTGISGDTSQGLLQRFEEDAAMYRPHLAFVTIGCNDANPNRNLPVREFESNLMELHRRFAVMGCGVVFQTYYAINPDGCDPVHLNSFYKYMDVVRKVATVSGADIIDHLERWELLRKTYPEKYLPLMRDGFHVNHRGNMLMGVDIARRFGAEFGDGNLDFWGESLILQRLMDGLENGCKHKET